MCNIGGRGEGGIKVQYCNLMGGGEGMHTQLYWSVIHWEKRRKVQNLSPLKNVGGMTDLFDRLGVTRV